MWSSVEREEKKLKTVFYCCLELPPSQSKPTMKDKYEISNLKYTLDSYYASPIGSILNIILPVLIEDYHCRNYKNKIAIVTILLNNIKEYNIDSIFLTKIIKNLELCLKMLKDGRYDFMNYNADSEYEAHRNFWIYLVRVLKYMELMESDSMFLAILRESQAECSTIHYKSDSIWDGYSDSE